MFHDVDLLPENDKNLYTCPDIEHPRHMSVGEGARGFCPNYSRHSHTSAVDTMKYKLMYKTLFGGAVALTTGQVRTVNGFSNQFWGWGGKKRSNCETEPIELRQQKFQERTTTCTTGSLQLG